MLTIIVLSSTMTNPANAENYRLLLETARLAIEQYLTGQPLNVPALDTNLNTSQGVFVTLWEPSKKLRGCIGRTQGITPTLTQEVAECAIMAATRDTRFTPLRDTLELQNLSIELSLLMPLEEISSTASLDPHRYGVVVMAGSKRGLLLPNVDGIETVEKQLQIAKEKGKIDAHEECQLARFEVLKITEQDAPA